MRTIHLICHPQWMKDEFSQTGIYQVKHSYGLEVPQHDANDLWWAPQTYAAKLNHALTRKSLQTVKFPGSGMEETVKSDISQKIFSREVILMTAEQALQSPEAGFWKYLDHKNDNFPAKYRTSREIVEDISENRITPEEKLLLCATKLDIVEEHRIFFNPQKLASSMYVTTDSSGQQSTVYDGALQRIPSSEIETYFSEDIKPLLAKNFKITAGVADIAVLKDGTMLLLELNTPWSSAWYDCDMAVVHNTIEHVFTQKVTHWEPSKTLQAAIQSNPVILPMQ